MHAAYRSLLVTLKFCACQIALAVAVLIFWDPSCNTSRHVVRVRSLSLWRGADSVHGSRILTRRSCICGRACAEILRRDLAQRSCIILYRDPLQRSCVEICDRPRVRRPCREISYRDLTKKPLIVQRSEISYRDPAKRPHRELVQRSCQETSYNRDLVHYCITL